MDVKSVLAADLFSGRAPNLKLSKVRVRCCKHLAVIGVLALGIGASACDTSSNTDQTSGSASDAVPSTDRDQDPKPAEDGQVTGDDGDFTPPQGEGGNESDDYFNSVFTPSSSDLVDNVDIYHQDGYDRVDVIRLDLITRTNAGECTPDDQSGCTLDDVLQDTDSRDDFKVEIPVHFSGTDFSDDGTLINAELRQRGGGARIAPQKSFRIKLGDKNQLWRGERHLQLNKHPFDNSRIRNKLSFDIISKIPHLPSFRTQFVNLWVDDGEGPVDHGLYTHVERGDERYLKRHGLDDDARLYKAEFFRFRESDRKSLLIDDQGKPLDKSIFEAVLEIENGKDHRNLVAMLEAFHDPEQSFESVLDRYFNHNNVLTWISLNLLLGQQDATRHNYFLYNPEDSEKFYFLPWDYDLTFLRHDLPENSFSAESLRDRLGFGYAVAHENEFLDRYFRSEGAHERIVAATSELRNSFIGDSFIAERAAELSAAIAPFASAHPDIEFNEYFLPDSTSDFASKVAFNYSAVLNNFSIPLPPTLHAPQLSEGVWEFSWTTAHELTGHQLTYELQVASAPDFLPDDIVQSLTGIESNEDRGVATLDNSIFGAGTRYVRLIARSVIEPERFWQVADNRLEIEGVTHYGVVEFEVL